MPPIKFDPATPVRVGNKPITTLGQSYAAGAAFPWRSLGYTERRVRLLVEQRNLVQDQKVTSAVQSERSAAAPPPIRPVQAAVAVPQPRRR